jgi:hypothetical protein
MMLVNCDVKDSASRSSFGVRQRILASQRGNWAVWGAAPPDGERADLGLACRRGRRPGCPAHLVTHIGTVRRLGKNEQLGS